MKAFAVFFLLASVGQLIHAVNLNDLQKDLVQDFIVRGAAEKLKGVLEDLKDILRTGNSSLGIPKIDPFDLAFQKFNFKHELINAVGEVENAHAEGVSNYAVQEADFKIGKKLLTLNLLWPHINGKAKYDIDAKVMNKYPIYGAGQASVDIQDFNFATECKLKFEYKEKKVSILSFTNTIITLRDLKLDVSGLFHDDELSEFISAVVSELAPETINDFQSEIVEQVNKIMFEVGNEFLKNVSLDDILGMIS